jgi:hypothetical protein
VPEAKSDLSKLLKRVQLGEEIIIARGRPTHSSPSALSVRREACLNLAVPREFSRSAPISTRPSAGDPKGIRVKVLLDTHAFSGHNG